MIEVLVWAGSIVLGRGEKKFLFLLSAFLAPSPTIFRLFFHHCPQGVCVDPQS